ncbi:MAG TPA: type IV pilin protein [Burkholderiaceae bacterium]|jgi:type IV pilus assembly protein PilE|nr:type IV pilin protein [Burkholderiaceae bacterium]
MFRADIRGFTLIELLLVVAILGVITAFALPAYNDQVEKSRRRAAQSTMMQVSQQLERFYTENSRYTASMSELGWSAGHADSEGGGHRITVGPGATGIATSYVITATPLGSDARCGQLTLTNTSVRGATGTSPAGCW